jgi:triacylglycerol esterase/lipase EstA (alpha/beta hydrolase family)
LIDPQTPKSIRLDLDTKRYKFFMPLPTVILPGYLAGAAEYQPLAKLLTDRGFPTSVVPLVKWDWVQTLGGRSVVPILDHLHQTVQQAKAQHQTDQINLIGHSAGGWIARIYLGEQPYDVHGGTPERACWSAHPSVSRLITLGTPHISQERWTRKNLDFVNLTYPNAFHANVQYVCVAGRAIFGKRRWGSWLAYSSYQLTCGQGNCWGDGITPITAAHLAGAKNLTLEGVRHAPTSGGLWYGSPEVVPQWVDALG